MSYSNDRPGYVYFLWSFGDTRYKIGLAKAGRLKDRLQELNRQQAARQVIPIGWIEVNDCYSAEKNLHELFEEYRLERTEWFDFGTQDPDDLEAVIEAYAKVQNKF